MARTSLAGRRRVLVRPTADGGHVLATADEHYASASYHPRAWVAKLDAAGAVAWQNAYGDLWLVERGAGARGGVVRIADTLPETVRPLTTTATAYTTGSAAFTTSPSGLTVVQDAP